jgi:hypothetical protein
MRGVNDKAPQMWKLRIDFRWIVQNRGFVQYWINALQLIEAAVMDAIWPET